MEYGKIIADKSSRFLILIISFLLLGLILSGLFIGRLIENDYKNNIIEHDFALAGFLIRSGADKKPISDAFLSEKTNQDINTGRELLESFGYTKNAQRDFLYEVRSFGRKYTFLLCYFFAVFSLLIFIFLYRNLLKREKQLEKASAELKRFLDGNYTARLSDCGEGSLDKLMTSVNTMATALTAHIENEKQNRQFLKETISDISHQLKTPLAALSMYNEIIQNENSGSEVVLNFTEKSRRELDRMESLIHNLLKLAKLDAGTIELEKALYNVREFLTKCVNSFVTRAEKEGKSINLSCEKDILLAFDEIWLCEALENIIKNSLDHTQSAGRIEIRCSETSIATEIIVCDNGSGIHKDDIHHIFKRFYRSRYSKDKQGVGIGLSLSKTIIEKHGGSITLVSEVGKGTEFRLIFPKLTNM